MSILPNQEFSIDSHLECDPFALPSLPIQECRSLPAVAGVYFVLTDDEILYVGKSVNIAQRWLSHHRLKQVSEIPSARIAWIEIERTEFLKVIESAFIAKLQPPLNGDKVPRSEGQQRQVKITIPEAEWQTISKIAQKLGTTEGDVVFRGFRYGMKDLCNYLATLKSVSKLRP